MKRMYSLLFPRIVTREYEALVFCLDEGETPGNAGEDGAHASTYDLLKGVEEWEFLLVDLRLL